MLGLTGAFIVIRQSGVEPHILSETAYRLFVDRIAVVGSSKANQAQFGNDALYALPCVAACLEHVALHYEGIHKMQVRAICATIALGKPLPTDSSGESTEGGLGVIADSNKPIKPSGSSGVKQKHKATKEVRV
jgi:hypothetical protein